MVITTSALVANCSEASHLVSRKNETRFELTCNRPFGLLRGQGLRPMTQFILQTQLGECKMNCVKKVKDLLLATVI